MLTPVVILGGAFGVMAVDDDDTVAFAGDERFVSVSYEVGDYEDMGDDTPAREALL